MKNVLLHLRRAVLSASERDRTDGQLLGCFVEQRDDAAFAALVRRHGPMVWGVCRRMLRNEHDAEDAFQATFLVLVRKARSVTPRDRVANWLHGVAYYTALKARAAASRRHMKETPITAACEPEAAASDAWNDVAPILDQELNRLPEKYRVPIVLCDLEGRGHAEAAQLLGWPVGTLSGRLSRARALLVQRLIRHGAVLSAGALASVLAQNGASACVPISLASATLKAASLLAAGEAAVGLVSTNVLALMEGVVQAMFLSKLKISIGVPLLVAASLGAGAWAYQTQSREPTPATGDAGIKAAALQTPENKPLAGAQKPKPDEPNEEKLRQEAKIRELTIRELEDKAAIRKWELTVREKQVAEEEDRKRDEANIKLRAILKAEQAAEQARDIELQRWRALFAGGKVDVFVDGNSQKPFVELAQFDGVVEIGGKKFLQFHRGPPVFRQKQRLLVDPARITGMTVNE